MNLRVQACCRWPHTGNVSPNTEQSKRPPTEATIAAANLTQVKTKGISLAPTSAVLHGSGHFAEKQVELGNAFSRTFDCPLAFFCLPQKTLAQARSSLDQIVGDFSRHSTQRYAFYVWPM